MFAVAFNEVLNDLDENGILPEHPKLETFLLVGFPVANEIGVRKLIFRNK